MENISFSNIKNSPIQTNSDDNIKNYDEDEKYANSIDSIRNELISRYDNIIKTLIQEKTPENVNAIKSYLMIILESYPVYKNDIEKIYNDIFGFAFIDDYLNDPEFEEMNGNSWDNIEVITKKQTKIVTDGFSSAEHAKNIIKKMMRIGGAVLDEAQPTLDSYIGTGLRLTATITPIVDDEVGVTFSLRKLKGKKILVKQLIDYDSYSEEETDFITTCLKYGVSILFGGATSSGKSSDMQSFLEEVLKNGQHRCYTIEENTRELDLLIKDNLGKSISRVIHTKTRYSSSNNSANTLNVDQDLLVKTALRYHPDIIVPAEMRGKEAKEAVDASQTGHTIVSSAHIKTVTASYKRLLFLLIKAVGNIDIDILMEAIIDAFPIVVFKRQLKEDRSRKCEKIFEAVSWDKKEKKIVGNILYRYMKAGIIVNGGKPKVVGEHKKIAYPSFRLCQQLYEGGLDVEYIKENINPNFEISEEIDYVEDYIKYEGNEILIEKGE